MDKRYFSEKVAEWYVQNKRDLPWRTTKDPYKIWLSEIILQQTRVSQGLPYYERFVEKFPNVFSLAEASEQEVLHLWQGLGYYTRARNLHKCAKEVITRHQGIFPKSYKELLQLPGIGEYTAAAIASITNGEPVAVVDGNVFRVLSRVFGIETEINSLQGKKIFTELANQLIDATKPDVHNQAMMEFGALWCTPKTPQCERCAMQSLCFAARHKMQHLLPVKAKAKAARKRYFYYFVFRRGKSILLKKRTEKDIWNGLYDFYLVEKNRPVGIDRLSDETPLLKSLKNGVTYTSGTFKHVLSHQVIIAKFIEVEVPREFKWKEDGFRFYSTQKMAALPKPVLITRFLQQYGQ